MYLVTVFENEAKVEASLGGRVTAEEIQVFGDHVSGLVSVFHGQPYNLLLDYSKAKALDRQATAELAKVKDLFLSGGAQKIVSVPGDEHELVRHTTSRLQAVLEGHEEFVADPSKASFPDVATRVERAA